MKSICLCLFLYLVTNIICSQNTPPPHNDAEVILEETKNKSVVDTKKAIDVAYDKLIFRINDSYTDGWIDRHRMVYDGVQNREQPISVPSYVYQPKTEEQEILIRDELIRCNNSLSVIQEYNYPQTSFYIVADEKRKYGEYMEYIIDTIFYTDGTQEIFKDEELIYHNISEVLDNNKMIDRMTAQAAYRICEESKSKDFVPQIGKRYVIDGQEIEVLEMEGNYLRYLHKDIKEGKDIETHLYTKNRKGEHLRSIAIVSNLENGSRPQEFNLDKTRQDYAHLYEDMQDVENKLELNSLIKKYLSAYVTLYDGNQLDLDVEMALSGNASSLIATSRYFKRVKVGRTIIRNPDPYQPQISEKKYVYTEQLVSEDTEEDEFFEPNHITHDKTVHKGFANKDGIIVIPRVPGSDLTSINQYYYHSWNNDTRNYWQLAPDLGEAVKLDVDKVESIFNYSRGRLIGTEYLRENKARHELVRVLKNGKLALWGAKGAITDFVYDTIEYDKTTARIAASQDGKVFFIVVPDYQL